VRFLMLALILASRCPHRPGRVCLADGTPADAQLLDMRVEVRRLATPVPDDVPASGPQRADGRRLSPDGEQQQLARHLWRLGPRPLLTVVGALGDAAWRENSGI